MHRQDFSRTVLIWMALGLVIRLIYLLDQGTNSVLFYQPLLDELEVSQQADQLLRGEGFGHEPLFKAPLYAIIVAAVKWVSGDGWFWMLRFLQHVCGVLFIGFTLDATRRLLGPGRETEWVLHVVGAVLCFYAPMIRLENQLILDFFVVFFQSAMIWALIRSEIGKEFRWRWIIAASVFAALAWLTRPTMTVVLPFLALWIIGNTMTKGFKFKPLRLKTRCLQAGIFALGTVLAMIAVTARNGLSGGEALTMPWQGGYSFYVSNVDGANGRYYLQKAVASGADANPARANAVDGFLKATQTPREKLAYSEVTGWWNNQTWLKIGEAPIDWLKLMGWKALYLVSEREIFNFEEFRIHKNLSPVLQYLPFGFGIIWPLAFASFGAFNSLGKGRRRLFILLWVYGIFLAMGVALYLVSGRLRMPLVFPAILLAGVTLRFFLLQLQQRKFRVQSILTSVLLLIGVAMSWGDWKGVRSENLDFAEYARLSNAAFYANNGAKALEFAELAAKTSPNYPALPQLRAQAFYMLKQYGEAAKNFEQAAILTPQDASPMFNLATILFDHFREYATAAAAYEEALKRDPRHARAAWGALKAQSLVGNLERAKVLSGTLPSKLPLEQWPGEALGAAAIFASITQNPDLNNKIQGVLPQLSERNKALVSEDLDHLKK